MTIPSQTQDLGYDAYDPITNLGTVAYLTGFYVLRVLFLFCVLGPIKTFTKFGHSRFIKMYKRVFFSEILLILIEGYLDFAITLFLYGMYNPLIDL